MEFYQSIMKGPFTRSHKLNTGEYSTRNDVVTKSPHHVTAPGGFFFLDNNYWRLNQIPTLYTESILTIPSPVGEI